MRDLVCRAGGGPGRAEAGPPTAAGLFAPPRPDLFGTLGLVEGAHPLAVWSAVRAPGASHCAGGISPGPRGCGNTPASADRTGRRNRRVLVDGAGGAGLSSAARRRVPGRGHLCRRDRRRAPLRHSPAAHGVSRAHAIRTLDRRAGQARRDHQGRQYARASCAGRRRLDLSLARTGEPINPGPAGRVAPSGAGNRPSSGPSATRWRPLRPSKSRSPSQASNACRTRSETVGWAKAEAGLRWGTLENPMWPTPSTPDCRQRQPQTNPRKRGTQPAHKSMLTLV